MITEHDIQRKDSQILLGIAVESAVLDIITNDEQLRDCIKLLQEPHRGLVYLKMGSFGTYDVTLNVHHDDTASIFLDGPDFSQSRNQSAGIYVDKIELLHLLVDVLNSV